MSHNMEHTDRYKNSAAYRALVGFLSSLIFCTGLAVVGGALYYIPLLFLKASQ